MTTGQLTRAKSRSALPKPTSPTSSSHLLESWPMMSTSRELFNKQESEVGVEGEADQGSISDKQGSRD